MPEKPRVFEAEAYILPAIELQDHPAKDAAQVRKARKIAGSQQASGAPKGYALSREVILRLIDWFRDE